MVSQLKLMKNFLKYYNRHIFSFVIELSLSYKHFVSFSFIFPCEYDPSVDLTIV